MAITKRKYTVSEKVLAANRLNLEKANAVPKSIRFRATARRLASCHANLQKAQAAQRDPQKPGRRGRMGHGFRVVDLRRTAAQAGERLEELDRHRALFLETFGGSREQSRLAQACADILWRRWRALAWEAERETKQFYGRLAQHADPLPGSGITRAELQVSRALDCLVVLAGLGDLSNPLGQLTRRFERLARTWMGLHTDEPVSFPFGTQPSISPIEWGHWKQSPAALSNPCLSSGNVAKRLEQSQKPPRALDPPEEWRPWGSGARARDCNLSPVTSDLELPADFQSHRQQLKAAFGSASADGGSEELSSNGAAFLERAAQLSWQRLRLIDEHLEKERAAVASFFAAGLEPGELAARLVVLLAGDVVLTRQAHQLERELQQTLYGWLTQQELGPCCEALRPETKQPTVASILAEIKRTNQRQEQSTLQFAADRELEQVRQKLDREFGWERSFNPPGEDDMDSGWLRDPGFSDFKF